MSNETKLSFDIEMVGIEKITDTEWTNFKVGFFKVVAKALQSQRKAHAKNTC